MIYKHLIAILCLIIITSSSLFAVPKNVIITRHADKVKHGFCLSLQGLERASAFVNYFTQTPIYNAPPITHIFAAYRGEPRPYIRCQQTCQPLADHLKIPLNISFSEYQLNEVSQEILTNPKYNGATVLMCWEHEHIRPLVIAFGGKDPGYWPHDVFDQVYMLTFSEGSKPKLQKVLQSLMFGDRATFEAQPAPLPQVAVPCPSV